MAKKIKHMICIILTVTLILGTDLSGTMNVVAATNKNHFENSKVQQVNTKKKGDSDKTVGENSRIIMSEHIFADELLSEKVGKEDAKIYVNGVKRKDVTAGKTINYKSVTLYTDLVAPSYKDAKGKDKKGKLIIGVSSSLSDPIVKNNKMAVDPIAKNVASVSYNKKKNSITVTAKKNAGTVYIWVMTLTEKDVVQDVGYAPVQVVDTPQKITILDKTYADEEAVKYVKDTVAVGDDVNLYLYPTKGTEIVQDVSYIINPAKGMEDYVEITPIDGSVFGYNVIAKGLKKNKKTTVKLTAACVQNNKKASFTLVIENYSKGFELSEGESIVSLNNGKRVSNVEVGDYKSYSLLINAPVGKKNSVATVKIQPQLSSDSFSETDKPKIYAMSARDGFTIDSKGKIKITCKPMGEGKKISGKIKNNVLTVTAQKKVSNSAKTYFLVVYNTYSSSGYFVVPVHIWDGEPFIEIDTGNLLSEEDDKLCAIGDDFNDEINGTIVTTEKKVKKIEYTVKDDADIEILSGEIKNERKWDIKDIGFALGSNTLNVRAILDDDSVLSDSIQIVSNDGRLMDKISIDNSDDDGDGLNNYLEENYKTDKNKTDTDGDGLSDYIEIMNLNGYDPLLVDTDGNGINDGDEDFDRDSIKNSDEIVEGTDPALADTDGDGLSDYDEKNQYHTDPLKIDTDEDGAEDGWEVEFGFDPLSFNDNFDVTIAADTPDSQNPVTAGVDIDLDGDDVATMNIQPVSEKEDSLISSAMPGYMGAAYEFHTSGKFDAASITFKYDTSLGTIGSSFQPRIYYYNENEGVFEELANQQVSAGSVTATVSHFSKYILLNKIAFEAVWKDDIIKVPTSSGDGDVTTMDVVFVLDYSWSMTWNDEDQKFKKVAKNFVSRLKRGADRAAVIKFVRNPSLVSGLTTDKNILNDAIDSIEYDNGSNSNSGTNGSAGYNMALNELSKSTADYKFIIFMTDGEDTYSSYNYDSLISKSISSNISVFTIGMGTASQSTLMGITSRTGGKYYRVDALNLDEAFLNIEEETEDLEKDSNNDGIPDYFNDLIKEGKLKLGNGMSEYKGIDFNYNKGGNLSDDYDGDGLKNGQELIVKYNKETGRVFLRQVSSPIYGDMDGDGLGDNVDPHPEEWDVCDRDLAMFAALAYEDGTANDNSFYNLDKETEEYYWLKFANIKELSGKWEIKCPVDIWTQKAQLDKFSATTYINGNNVVVAYRGTNETMEWLDNILCYGLINHHAEERLARQYIERIYNQYVRWNSQAKLYITGHSLGGYLSQIGAAELISNNQDDQLERVAYFNGIGMKFNKSQILIKDEKQDEIEALKQYGRNADGKTPNGKLICHHIRGDWVSMLGTHYGDEAFYYATDEARKNHSGKHGGTYSSFADAIKSYCIDRNITRLGVILGSIAASPKVAFYYAYYHPKSFVEYSWITHETDSFLYYLKRGKLSTSGSGGGSMGGR